MVGILSVFVDTEVLELCFITDTDLCCLLWITIDCVFSMFCIVALGLVRHFVFKLVFVVWLLLGGYCV